MSGTVCFTGKGIDPVFGALKIRTEWEALARANGFLPVSKVDANTRYLVASRDDTTKAKAARVNGTHVISYNDFYAMCKGAAAPAAFNAAPPPPLDTTGMEEVEGWGMF